MIEFDPTKSVVERCLQAGSRTYYFDIKQTKASDYFLTITERKKDTNGKLITRQKLYLYKKKIDGFAEILNEMMTFIKEEKGEQILR